jgi:hypothetical protein
MVTVSGPNLPDVRLTGDDDYYYRMFSARLEDGGTLLEGDAAHRLSPGTHRIRGAGGRAVGAFEAALEIPENLKWVNRSSVAEVRRDAGVEVTWTGARPQDRVIIQGGTMYVAGGTADWPDLEAVLFICAPPLGATSFTVPANILRSIPAGGDTKDSAGMVRVIAVTGASSTRFSASLPGGGQIGAGTVGYLSMITKAVPFR